MSDVMCFFDAALDEAIKDGVDVLSVSIGVGGPPFRPFNVNDIEQDLEIGSFHAMTKGIPVTAGAGNSGSEAYTIAYSSPTPHIVAPGVLLLSADINDNQEYQSDFAITQGTSVATPVVTGIVLLLKSLHPDRSPAALKSAIMTTGS
ncbi:unnamed protein product [Brassica oleracea]